MCSLYNIIQIALGLYSWVLVAAAIMSWLRLFGVLNRTNHAVVVIEDMLYRVTEPALRPLRRVVPLLGGVDISFVVLYLLIILIRMLLGEYLYPVACGGYL